MDRIAGRLAVLAVLAVFLVPASEAQNNTRKAGTVTIWQARRTINAVEYADNRFTKGWGRIDRATIRFTPDTLEFDTTGSKAGTQHFKVDLKTLGSLGATCKDLRTLLACTLHDNAKKSVPKDSPLNLFWRQGPWSFGYCNNFPPSCLEQQMRVVSTFVAAFGRLQALANDPSAPLRTFTQRAAAWRALATKPPIPEEVRVQRLLAEDAIKLKKLEEALYHYETGLELYPTWPPGYFNAALIAAEMGHYAQAVEHMQAYLELVPDAPDAQAARDQIAIWQYKARQSAN